MEIVKVLLVFFLAIDRDLHMAKAYMDLKNPSKALNILEKVSEEKITEEQHLEVDIEKAENTIELNQPLKGLQLLQQLILLEGLSPYDKERIYELISFAFLKLQQTKRAAYFGNLASNERCAFDRERAVFGCQFVPLGNEPLPTVSETGPQENPFDEAISLQTRARDMTINLPFFSTEETDNTPVIEAQASVQKVQEPFVKLLYNKEKDLTPDCHAENYSAITTPFSEGLSLAKAAEGLLREKKLTFAEIIPVQQNALDKFKEAKDAFDHLPPPVTNPQAQQESQNRKDLENMMEDEKKMQEKKVPSNTDRVIW